jgi:hypothetical protein
LKGCIKKGLKGYAPIGYAAKGDSKPFESINAIFNNNNFLTVFNNDILSAKNEIIIVSPYIGKRRLAQMLNILLTAINNGTRVTVITRPEAPQPPGKTPDEEQLTQIEINVQYIRENLQLGFPAEKVQELLGGGYSEVTSAMDGEKMWRYDFPREEGYRFEDPYMLDFIDLDGLRSGLMRMQLYVTWTGEDTVACYTVYSGDGSGKIYEYRVFPDGTEKESGI